MVTLMQKPETNKIKQKQAIVPLATPTNNTNKKNRTPCSMQVKFQSNNHKTLSENFPPHQSKTKGTFYTKGKPHSTIARG